jgi:hypothetical protein
MATQQATPATMSSVCAPHGERQRQHGHQTEQADAQMRLPPADGLDQVLHDGRPDGAGEVVAAGHDGHCQAAPLFKPVRDIGHQGAEEGRTAERADEQALRQRVGEQCWREAGQHIADCERDDRERQRPRHAKPIGQPPHGNAAQAKANHGERVRQRGRAAINAKVGLHRRQRDHHRPHAHTAERAQCERRSQAAPRGRSVDQRACGGGRFACGVHRAILLRATRTDACLCSKTMRRRGQRRAQCKRINAPRCAPRWRA